MQLPCDYWGHNSFLNTHVRCRYISRLHDSLQDFGTRFSDIDAIHQQALAAECVQVKPTWWKRLLPSFCRGLAADAGGILSFMTTLDESQVIEVTADALGAKLPAHRDFEARYHIDNAAAKRVRRNLTSSTRHSAGAHETSAAASHQQRTSSSAFHESAAATRRFKTSGADDPLPISLEGSARNEVASAELVEVVVDPPSTVTVERNGRTSASDNRRDRIPTRTPSNMRASSRPKRPLERDGHEDSQFSGANYLSSVPASMSASAAPDSFHADFIEKIDSKSGRSYWVNLKTKARSWAPPDAWHAASARADAVVSLALPAVGGTFSTILPESNERPSTNAQVNRIVNIELENDVARSTAPSMQRDKQKSAAVQRQGDTQDVHTVSPRASSTSAGDRMLRQSLADLAAVGDDSVIKHASSSTRLTDAAGSLELPASRGASARNFIPVERRTPESHDGASSNAQVNRNVNIELEEVAHSAVPPTMQWDKQMKASVQRRDEMKHVLAQKMSAFPQGVGADSVAKEHPKGIKQQQSSAQSSVANANALSPQVKLSASVTDSVALGLSQAEVQRRRDPGPDAQPSEAPPPFEEEDLKLAKRREAKAAARAAQKQSSLSATSALGSSGSRSVAVAARRTAES